MKFNKIKFAAPIKYIVYMSMLGKEININNQINFNKKIEELRKEIIKKYDFDPEEIKDNKIITINNKKYNIREFLINIGNKLGREKGFIQLLKNEDKFYEYLNIEKNNNNNNNIYINNKKIIYFIENLKNNLLRFAKEKQKLIYNEENIWVFLSLQNIKNNQLNLITDLRYENELISFLLNMNNKLLINLIPIKNINNNIYYNSTEININKNYSTFLKIYQSTSNLKKFISILNDNKLVENPEILSTILSFNEYIKTYHKDKLNKKLNEEISEKINSKVDYLKLFNDKNNCVSTKENINKIRQKSTDKNIIAVIGPKRVGKDFYIEEAIIKNNNQQIQNKTKIK